MEEELIIIEPEETELVIIEDEIQFIEPVTQEITIEPTFENVIKTPDEGFTGFSKVTVKSIPEEYIIPTGEIEITENGSYDVVEKAVANVNVPEKVLGTKIIDKNGTYNAIDDNLDGYSSVEVATSGVDINNYFMETVPQAYHRSSIKNINPNIVLGVPTNMNSFLEGYVNLEKVPYFDTSAVTNMQGAFSECRKLKSIPHFNTSKVTSFYETFYNCVALEEVPLLDTSSATNMNFMLSGCSALKTIPTFDTSKVTTIRGFALGCSSITEFPELDLSNVTDTYYLVRQCKSLKRVPNLNTYKSTNFQQAFLECTSLEEIGTIEAESVVILNINLFKDCRALTHFGGFNNLGQAYLTTRSANYFEYKLDMSPCINLTEQSLINILTKLYDIKTKGCKTQSVVLGATNLAKLTSEAGQQALAQAQNFGWTIS